MKNKKSFIVLYVVVFFIIVYYAYGRISLAREKKISQANLVNENITTQEKEEKSSVAFNGERSLYNLDIALNTDNKTVKGHEEVKFKNKYNKGLKEIVFHLYTDSYNSAETMPSIGAAVKKVSKDELGDIKINSVIVNGENLKYTEDSQVLKFLLNKELKPNEVIDIAIDFTLKVPKGNDRLSYQNDQYSLTNWYPILSIYDEKTGTWDETPFYPVGESNYSDCSDYKVSVTVPKGIVAATTGVKVSDKEEGSQSKLDFEASNNRDFVLFLSKRYKLLSKEVDGIRVNSFYVSEETTAKRMLDLACESLSFYNKTFGKYPYPEYDVVETYLQGGAMEYPTVTQMGPYNYLKPEYKENSLTFLDEAVVHETGHQWWFSTVGNNEFREPVLDESFTAYSTALFFENKFGEYTPMGVKGAFLTRSIKGDGPIYRPTDKFDWQNFSKVVYTLGPIALEDLRQKAGQEKFIDIFKTYYDRYKFKNATFDGFLEVVKEKCGSETSDYVRNAFTSSNYSMDKMVLSPEEVKKVQDKSRR